MSVIEELRQNDPARTRFYIRLRDQRSDAELAQALEQNAFVRKIELNLFEEPRADWNILLRVIATRANLDTVKVRDNTWFGLNAPAVLVRSILRAVQQNTALRSVEMRWLRLPTEISAFVDNASSITSFSIYGCDMEDAERQQGARSLAAALQRNTNIKTLALSRLDDIYAVPILEGLRLNTAVKTFIFNSSSTNLSDETSHAVHQLLQSTTSIQKFELQQVTFSEGLFCAIAQAITSSECVHELKFSVCQFYGQSSIAQLQGILLNKGNLTSLCLHGCNFGGVQVHEAIISTLLKPDSCLRCFELISANLPQTIPDIQFTNLLQAIQKSKLLERFQIGTIQTQQQSQTLTQSIPSMRIRELEVAFERQFWREHVNLRQNLLLAVKNNFSLRSVKGEMQDNDLFGTAEDKKTLAFYVNRNESLDQWVDHPETVQQKVWPDALGLAERAGPDALFRGLRSVLGSDYVHLPGGRKRKRTQHYTPS